MNKQLTKFMDAFDDALNWNPFLWLEIGYTRPTDWMVHVWDKSGGGELKVLEVQELSMEKACKKARKILTRYVNSKTQEQPSE